MARRCLISTAADGRAIGLGRFATGPAMPSGQELIYLSDVLASRDARHHAARRLRIGALSLVWLLAKIALSRLMMFLSFSSHGCVCERFSFCFSSESYRRYIG